MWGAIAEGGEMSPQIEFLKNLIQSAQKGDEGAITVLRRICVSAAEKAPVHDLITIGRCLVHIGVEATRTETGRN
jgi:hypothetical protein